MSASKPPFFLPSSVPMKAWKDTREGRATSFLPQPTSSEAGAAAEAPALPRPPDAPRRRRPPPPWRPPPPRSPRRTRARARPGCCRRCPASRPPAASPAPAPPARPARRRTLAAAAAPPPRGTGARSWLLALLPPRRELCVYYIRKARSPDSPLLSPLSPPGPLLHAPAGEPLCVGVGVVDRCAGVSLVD